MHTKSIHLILLVVFFFTLSFSKAQEAPQTEEARNEQFWASLADKMLDLQENNGKQQIGFGALTFDVIPGRSPCEASKVFKYVLDAAFRPFPISNAPVLKVSDFDEFVTANEANFKAIYLETPKRFKTLRKEDPIYNQYYKEATLQLFKTMIQTKQVAGHLYLYQTFLRKRTTDPKLCDCNYNVQNKEPLRCNKIASETLLADMQTLYLKAAKDFTLPKGFHTTPEMAIKQYLGELKVPVATKLNANGNLIADPEGPIVIPSDTTPAVTTSTTGTTGQPQTVNKAAEGTQGNTMAYGGTKVTPQGSRAVTGAQPPANGAPNKLGSGSNPNPKTAANCDPATLKTKPQPQGDGAASPAPEGAPLSTTSVDSEDSETNAASKVTSMGSLVLALIALYQLF